MRTLTLILVVLTIAALNVILFLGASAPDTPEVRVVFNFVVLVMDLALLSSSVLLVLHFGQQQRALWRSLFLLNLALVVLAAALRLSNVDIPLTVLFAVDIYWLNLYLICLCRELWPR